MKLGDEFLMSSLFTVAEIALANLALAAVPEAVVGVDVLVGGLGLGYTRAGLDRPSRTSMHVVEALPTVIEWHESGLLPFAGELTEDPRCHLVNGDFFAMVASEAAFGPDAPFRVDAALVDIDHSPRHLLDPGHAPFYTSAGLERLADRLHPGGVFGLWSDGDPDSRFIAVVESVFRRARRT